LSARHKELTVTGLTPSVCRRRLCTTLVGALCSVTLAGTAAAGDAALEKWIAGERKFAAEQLLRNISPVAADKDGHAASAGSVIASPAKGEPNQVDYFYHWVRDAALVTDVVVTPYEQASSDRDRQRYRALLKDYAAFSRTIQQAPAAGQAKTGLGEPKFFVNGTVFGDAWGRPQNDGAALRSAKLIRFAEVLLQRGDQADRAFVATLYGNKLPADSLIKADLEYVARHWPDPCFDLWEETQGQHFYTRLAQHRALARGARFARRMNDAGAAAFYLQEAKKLRPAIAKHLDPAAGVIIPIKDGAKNVRELDVAVILAVLHTHDPRDPLFGPTDENVLATAQKLANYYRTDAKFPINDIRVNGDQRALQPGIGRYPGDQYGGVKRDGGNPWFLATAALAELCYRAAADWSSAEAIAVTKRNVEFLRGALASTGSGVALAEGDLVKRGDPRFGQVIGALVELGDGYLRRVRQHADQQTGSLAEQFNRDTGFMQSARDLSWSYAAVLTAFQQRDRAVQRARELKRVPIPGGGKR
jgi:glucoamylase